MTAKNPEFVVYVLSFHPVYATWYQEQLTQIASMMFVPRPEPLRWKIGYTGNLIKRRSSIACCERVDSMSFQVELVLHFESARAARVFEKAMHRRFADKVIGRSEWFRLNRDDIDLIGEAYRIIQMRADGCTGRAIAAELSLPAGSVFQVIKEFRHSPDRSDVRRSREKQRRNLAIGGNPFCRISS